MTFKEESEAMFDVFVNALQDKFPDNQIHFSIVAIMENEKGTIENGEMAAQRSGGNFAIAYGLTQFLKAEPQVNREFLTLKLIGL